jgi:hypothetical protein
VLRGESPGGQDEFDTRLLPLLEPTATLGDAFRIASELYAGSILPPVIDPDVFRNAYLPGRAPNAARAVHAQESEDQTKQNKAGSDSEQDGSEGSYLPIPNWSQRTLFALALQYFHLVLVT